MEAGLTDQRFTIEQNPIRRSWPWLAGVLLVTALTLHGMGRVWWCKCGRPDLWTWHIWSMHNSQHVIDPYTFTHVIHGILFYGIFFLLLRHRATGFRPLFAVSAESTWEVLENTPAMIERYRAATISLDYVGDSIINSMADILACAGGYGLAALMPMTASAGLVLVTELVLLVWIRDNLMLNVVMLLYPIEGVRRWQGGG